MGVAAVIGLCRLLGVDAASTAFGWLWRTLAPWNHRHQRALENLAVAFPDMSPAERERIARASWENLGRTMAEGFLMDRIVGDPARVADDATARFEAQRLAGKGIVVVSAHFGNWEIGIHSTAAAGFEPAGVYKAMRNPIVERMITRRRAFLYPGGLYTPSAETPRRIISWVRSGHALAILADLREARGVDVPFFGQPARSTTFPALVARLLDVPLVAGRVTRTRGARFIVSSELVETPRTADRDADVLAATAALQATFERWIRETPEQWFWGMRRWR
ncbi:lysophospholipid acyltransferase family protein [Methylopila turkensis]|uniref:Lauroyl acyltransferase n=1 Tax=Methylopila turkensis TaxID=1437816 RepID=A0A9W6N7T6_9HYPH|nr:lauroyl acyltransferase [Methylopila turkensis]GLK80726.1 lauroyl acyltransferase [Methylopila turkensis]